MLKATILPNNHLIVEEVPVSHAVKFEGVEFFFPESWNGFNKTAVFSWGEDLTLSVILEESNPLCIGNNKCYIPAEILEKEEFYLSVFGVSGESRATTTKELVPVSPSGYALGDAPADPTPTEYEQIISLVNETKEIADETKELVGRAELIAQEIKQSADNGEFDGEKGEKGDKGDTGEAGVYYGTETPEIEGNPIWINPEGEGYEIEHTYNPSSPNPQSGKAVNEGITALKAELIEDITAVNTDVEVLETSVTSISGDVEEAKTAIGEINATLEGLRNIFYPVGSIYQSTLSTSPETLFGGAWEQIKDVFLLSAGDTYNAGAAGGEAVHVLTTAEMPEHKHNGVTFRDERYLDLNTGSENLGYNLEWHTAGGASARDMLRTATAGGGQAHNNMPPYLAVYMWKRIA